MTFLLFAEKLSYKTEKKEIHFIDIRYGSYVECSLIIYTFIPCFKIFSRKI